MTKFSDIAGEVHNNIQQRLSSSEPKSRSHVAVVDIDAEFQRVNAGLADVLKDSAMMYSKLSRLQGDFRDSELKKLREISEDILAIGNSLMGFSKGFYEGEYEMADLKGLAAKPNVELSPPMNPFSAGLDSEEEGSEEEESEEEEEEDIDYDEDEDIEDEYDEDEDYSGEELTF